MAENVLTLSTTDFDRPTITIDGEPYEMRSRQEISVKRANQIAGLGEELVGTPDKQTQQIADLLMKQVDLVMVDLPAEVKDKLSLGHLSMILEAFTRLGASGGAASSKEGS